MSEPRVRITSDGGGWNTHVYVDGVEIPASKISWSVTPGGTATATLVVPDVALDVKAYNIVKELPEAASTEGEPLAAQDTVEGRTWYVDADGAPVCDMNVPLRNPAERERQRYERERLAVHTREWFARTYGFTPSQVDELPPWLRARLIERGTRPDDDGTAGTREPRTPEPTPVAPSATTTAQDAGITLTLHVDGRALYDAIRPHSEAERARWRLRHGNWPLG